MKLPVLVVVGNNGVCAVAAAPKRSTRRLRGPRGNHSSHRLYHLADFAAIAASSRAAALSVSRAEDLPGVLEEAVSLIRTRRQSVLVDAQLAR